MICIEIRIILKINVTVPTLNLEIKLQTYGMEISGAVPKFALIDMAAPNDIKKSEIK